MFPFSSTGDQSSDFVTRIMNLLYNVSPGFKSQTDAVVASMPRPDTSFVRQPTYIPQQTITPYTNQNFQMYQPDPWAFSYGLKNMGNLAQMANSTFQPPSTPTAWFQPPSMPSGLLGPAK